MTNSAKRVAQRIELESRDAKQGFSEELARLNDEIAVHKSWNNTRRWIIMADIMAKSARALIDRLADKVKAIELSPMSHAAFAQGIESYLKFLDAEYEREWAKQAIWRADRLAPIPSAWEQAKNAVSQAYQFQSSEFLAAIKQTTPPLPEMSLSNQRAPAVKAGPPPTDEQILRKADEMKARGLNGRTIASQMRHEPGFENVSTILVRELILGRWQSGPSPKKRQR